MSRPILILLLVPVILCSMYAHGQNLITNPGFELKNHCPNNRGEISYTPFYDYFATVQDWVSPLNTTPDYFSTCATDSPVMVPYCTFDGYHRPHSGDAFAGISVFSGTPGKETEDYWSEYLETKLSSPLIAGHTYYLSMYACLTFHLPQYYNIVAIDKIGVRLTTQMIDTICNGPMFYVNGPADVETPPDVFISDTSWQLVSWIYHAKGGEQWFTLGAFYRDHVNVKLIYSPVNSLDSISSACNMFIDDVCVTDMEDPIVSDTTLYTPQFPITVGAINPGGQYLWSTGDTSFEINVVLPGVYTRQRWNNCQYYIDTFKVEEIALTSCVWLPNAFTPNNDGENDEFGPGTTYCEPDLQNFSFTIFNRWGQIVFQTTTPGEKWNGTFNGMPQEIGVYPYILKYTLTGPRTQSRSSSSQITMVKGDVTLIR